MCIVLSHLNAWQFVTAATAEKLSFLWRPNPVFRILKQVSEGCCCSGRKDKFTLLPPALPLTQAASQTEQSVPSTVPSQASEPFAHSLRQPKPITAGEPAAWLVASYVQSRQLWLCSYSCWDGHAPQVIAKHSLCTRQINGTVPV